MMGPLRGRRGQKLRIGAWHAGRQVNGAASTRLRLALCSDPKVGGCEWLFCFPLSTSSCYGTYCYLTRLLTVSEGSRGLTNTD